MKQILKILPLLAIGFAQANELDDLINASAAIVGKIDTASMMVGSAINYSYTGQVAEAGIGDSAKIQQAEVEAYNAALQNMSNFLPYGDAQTFLENAAADELELMHDAVDTFTEVVVDMATVIEVNEMASEAATPNEQKAVQDYVTSNVETLTIDQNDVETYNQSIDDIETHAANAGAYLGVAQNKDATNFLEQGAANNNTTFDSATVNYVAEQQWVAVSWGNGNATAVYINGNNFGLDLYVSEADVLQYGQETEFYTGSPTALGYQCFMNQINCDYDYEP